MEVFAKVRTVEQGNLCAVSDIVINDCITIRNLRIMKNKAGQMFISMPQTKNKDRWDAIITLDNQAVKDAVTAAVMLEYLKEVDRETGCDFDICVKSLSLCNAASGNLKAIASLNLDGITINNVRVMQNAKEELFVAMPQYKSKDKDGNDIWRDIVYPNNSYMREIVADRVLTAYQKAKKNRLPEPAGKLEDKAKKRVSR